MLKSTHVSVLNLTIKRKPFTKVSKSVSTGCCPVLHLSSFQLCSVSLYPGRTTSFPGLCHARLFLPWGFHPLCSLLGKCPCPLYGRVFFNPDMSGSEGTSWAISSHYTSLNILHGTHPEVTSSYLCECMLSIFFQESSLLECIGSRLKLAEGQVQTCSKDSDTSFINI